ncbi:hypothetical protein [Nocardia bovistercoris]|uniref:Glycine zipper domain-containing protein n=1 Tax=Nocardia bovistercoris TaxID=2785916 RepID=A0A931N6S4_9NOCA|nr:hypothetical protein [Nocardia bovistercoris]MBH0780846.1 hypothetical protein [Nocardia bovistercoris]
MAGRHRAVSERSKALRGIPIAVAVPAVIALGSVGTANAQAAPASASEPALESPSPVTHSIRAASISAPVSAVGIPEFRAAVEPVAAQSTPAGSPVARATEIAGVNENAAVIGQTAGQIIGGLSGALLGGAAGAVLATPLSAGAAAPIGIVAGGIIGGVIGTYAGYYVGTLLGSEVAERAPQIVPNILP